MLLQNSFKGTQLGNPRVKTAYTEKDVTVKDYFAAKKLNYEGFHLFIRAFKKEQKLEVWVREAGKDVHSLLHTYDFCAISGTLGPKRKEGDLSNSGGDLFNQSLQSVEQLLFVPRY